MEKKFGKWLWYHNNLLIALPVPPLFTAKKKKAKSLNASP